MKTFKTLPLAILLACTGSCTQYPAGTAPDSVDVTIDAGPPGGGCGSWWSGKSISTLTNYRCAHGDAARKNIAL